MEACEVFFGGIRRAWGEAEAVSEGGASTGASTTAAEAAEAEAAAARLVSERVAWIEEASQKFAGRVASRCLRVDDGSSQSSRADAHISDACASVLICLGHFDALFEDFPALSTAASSTTTSSSYSSAATAAAAVKTPPLLARFCTDGAFFAGMRGVVDAATEAYLEDDVSGGAAGGGGGSGDWLDAFEHYVESGGEEKWLRLLCEKGVAN